MDGFIRRAQQAASIGCGVAVNPVCRAAKASRPRDVVGYKDDRDIPNYWAYAGALMLQDHMFEPDATWSLPAHPVPGVGLGGPSQLADLQADFDFTKPPCPPLLPPPNNP
jgi:hypothetical protein